MLAGLSRYIVCSRVTKRPIFIFLSPDTRPNDSLQVFAFEDDYSFGVLASNTHWQWFVAQCSTLAGRFRYTSNTVFDTFPWPQNPSMAAVESVRDAARALRAERVRVMRENNWSLRDLYRSIELPGEHPLKTAQNGLDRTVRSAYGMGERDEQLEFLLDLNRELAERESRKETVIGPGLRALGGQFDDAYVDFVSEDTILG